jgi:hypothetical protein
VAHSQGQAVSARVQNPQIRVEDVEQISPAFIAGEMSRLREALGELARRAENHADPVDEYNTVSISGLATEQTLNILPTYEYMPEKIIAILVAGPPAGTATIILGDRQIPVVMPAAGILPIGPVGMIIGRSEPRQLVAASPGTWFLELMGFGDRRFKI